MDKLIDCSRQKMTGENLLLRTRNVFLYYICRKINLNFRFLNKSANVPPPPPILYFSLCAGVFKLLRSPDIDSKESIPPAYVAWRAGTTTLFLLGS